jgi:hypothetical protein
MSLQLHEWLNEFIAAHGLDADVENTRNEGLYVLNHLINDEREGYYQRSYGNVKCMTLSEFTAYDHTARNIIYTPELNEEDYQLTDFLYERKSGYVIINLRFNSSLPHENMMGMLYNAIEHKDLNMPEGAEAYIDKYGFSLSSVSYFRNILLGDNFVLNAQEKAAFSSYNFERYQ